MNRIITPGSDPSSKKNRGRLINAQVQALIAAKTQAVAAQNALKAVLYFLLDKEAYLTRRQLKDFNPDQWDLIPEEGEDSFGFKLEERKEEEDGEDGESGQSPILRGA